MRSPDEISLVSAHRRDGRSGGQGYRSSRVICKSFPESLGFESMKGHEKQPRRGIVWQVRVTLKKGQERPLAKAQPPLEWTLVLEMPGP